MSINNSKYFKNLIMYKKLQKQTFEIPTIDSF